MLRLLQVLAGLAAGVAIAEGAFWLRDDGAFPHLNVYVEDSELGVRLRPGAKQRVRFGGNPTTSVRINVQGFRGEDWPPDPRDSILVVGDSQVFGLGVEENETFSARLATLTNRPVLNAGVPTLGPPEMLQLARELVASHKPRTVVLTINMVNDLFEIARRNRERHRVWDGWAVRIETAPVSTIWFPFREPIMRKSHLVYAGRRFTYEQTAPVIGALPSEGSWKDLTKLDGSLHAAETAAAASDKSADRYLEELTARDQAAQKVDQALVKWAVAKEADLDEVEVEKQLVTARGNPGDIVASGFASESARPEDLAAYHLLRAAHARRHEGGDTAITADMVRRAVEYRQALERRAGAANDAALRDASVAWQAALGKLHDLRREPLSLAKPTSPLDAALEDLARLCRAAGCEPMVVVLPIDLQVAAAEWRKYGREPQDVHEIALLSERITRSATHLGIRAVDTLAALTAAEPGAFLQRDIHMTAKGHAAVAESIAAELSRPAPFAQPTGALPEGRSRVPSVEEFRRTPENVVRGSGKAGCETVQIDEWLRVQCRKGPGNTPRRAMLVQGSRDSFFNANADVMSVVAPVVPGTPLVVDLIWADRTQRLTATRESDGIITGVLEPPVRRVTPVVAPSLYERALCDCARALDSTDDCRDLYGATSAECLATYPVPTLALDNCRRLVACAQGFPGNLPSCPPGSAIAGGTNQCFPLCSDAVPCATGTCVAWPDTRVCMGGP